MVSPPQTSIQLSKPKPKGKTVKTPVTPQNDSRTFVAKSPLESNKNSSTKNAKSVSNGTKKEQVVETFKMQEQNNLDHRFVVLNNRTENAGKSSTAEKPAQNSQLNLQQEAADRMVEQLTTTVELIQNMDWKDNKAEGFRLLGLLSLAKSRLKKKL